MLLWIKKKKKKPSPDYYHISCQGQGGAYKLI